MQRVVRLSFAGLLAIAGAGLTACGDKVTVPPANPPAVDSVVHSVTVSPPSATIAIGGTITLGVSVDAGAGVTVRTVGWTSSDPSVATVGASDGKVTGVKAGTTTIIAKSTKDPNVSGAAVITVSGSGTVTVSIGQVAQNPSGNIVDLQNVAGQIDVTVNLDAQGGQTVAGVDLVMNCNAPSFPATSDTIVATQNISTADVAPLAAEAAAAPVTMSFNTAAFNKDNGNVAFRNGSCVLRAKVRTGSGTQVASSNTAITLNNTDFISLKSIATTPSAGQVATATDKNGFVWRAGAVNVSVVPVIYTAGRSIATAGISLVNSGNDAAIGQSGYGVLAPTPVTAGSAFATLSGLTASAGVISASFPNDTAATGGVGGAVVDTVTVSVNSVDNQGNTGPSLNSGFANLIRLDNRPPSLNTQPTWIADQQNTSQGWVGKAFVFTTVPATGAPIDLQSAGNDNAAALASAPGIGKVVDTTQWAKQGSHSASAFATFASVTSLAETPAASGSAAYDLRLKVCDALGNCAQSNAANNTDKLVTFGVDLTAPIATVAAGSVTDKSIFGIGAAVNTTTNIGATDPQGANGATGSGFSGTPVLAQQQRLFNSGSSSSTTSCTIGTPNGAGTACASPIQQGLTLVGATNDPGEYTLVYSLIDQAGNTSSATTVQYYIDGAAPTVSGGLAIPASITAGTTFSSSAADLMDLAGANGFVRYPIATIGATTRVAFAGTASPTGVAFDNALVRTGTANIALPSTFYRSMATITAALPGVIATSVKPDSVGIRASDAAMNLSLPNEAFLPPANISGTTPPTAAFTVPASLQAMTITVDNANVSIPPFTTANPAVNPLNATFTANVTAASLTSNTPFAQMCFYVVTPSGTESGAGHPATGLATNELSLLGCTSTLVTIDAGGVRTFKYTSPVFTPTKYAVGAVQFVAIGNNANGDALVSAPVTVTLTNP